MSASNKCISTNYNSVHSQLNEVYQFKKNISSPSARQITQEDISAASNIPIPS